MASISDTDKVFSGSVPKIYQTYLVPLIFEPYAADLAKRLRTRNPSRVLEIAAGTGVVTRALASTLPESTSIVATDLNQTMLDQAEALGTSRRVEWRAADAMHLPFPDGTFDAVVCQFGAMFFPDKPKAFSEAIRVLSPGGVFIFNVWDRIEENEFADTVTVALASFFPTTLHASWFVPLTAITTARLSRKIWPKADSPIRRRSRQSPRVAELNLRWWQRSHTAKGRHCGMKSRSGMRANLMQQLTRPPRPSRTALGPMQWMARFRRTLSSSKELAGWVERSGFIQTSGAHA